MNGNQIRKLREKLGLDSVLFSRLLGVHLSTVYRWEQAKKNPNIDILQRELLTFIDKVKIGHVDTLKKSVAEGSLKGLAVLLSWEQ